MNLEAFAPTLGSFGRFGGRYVSELLVPALEELEAAMHRIVPGRSFQDEYRAELARYAGRPTPLTHAPRLSEAVGLEVFLKREDLLHGGAHKTNNAIGQGLLARRLGKTRLIAETGAGQHGRAAAMIGARLGLATRIYMGIKDAERQAVNLESMRLCGAEVVLVEDGAGTLKEAVSAALREWTCTVDTTHYLLGSVCGPHPYPDLVREFQRVIGAEARIQFLAETGTLPDAAVACVGGGSNAIGLFSSFLGDDRVQLFGAEAGGRGLDTAYHGATLERGSPGVLHGARTYLLQDDQGQVLDAESAAAGLDYPGVGPEHAALKDSGRARYVAVTDREAVEAFRLLCRTEGIVPALESAHALALLPRLVERGMVEPGARVLVNVSGRGDKDLSRGLVSDLAGNGRADR